MRFFTLLNSIFLVLYSTFYSQWKPFILHLSSFSHPVFCYFTTFTVTVSFISSHQKPIVKPSFILPPLILNLASPLASVVALFGKIDTYLISYLPTLAATTSPSTRQPLLPVTVTITSLLFFILRRRLYDDRDIDAAVHSAGVAVATGVGATETVGVGTGGGVGFGGKVGAAVTVGEGSGGKVGTGVDVAVVVGDGTGVTVALDVAAGVAVATGVGEGDAAGVGVTAVKLPVVKSQLYAESIVVPA